MTKPETAIQLFDAYNKEDPHQVTWEEKKYPAAYFYALQLFDWVKKLEPRASEALTLASRCQHIGRWKMPRETFPMNKAGYLHWRTQLARFHADTAAGLMKAAGYEDEMINQVQNIILKKDIKANPEVQVMENALCLVFLEFQYDDFINKHDDRKVIHIIQKTWKKMSTPGKDAARALSFHDRGLKLIQQALEV